MTSVSCSYGKTFAEKSKNDAFCSFETWDFERIVNHNRFNCLAISFRLWYESYQHCESINFSFCGIRVTVFVSPPVSCSVVNCHVLHDPQGLNTDFSAGVHPYFFHHPRKKATSIFCVFSPSPVQKDKGGTKWKLFIFSRSLCGRRVRRVEKKVVKTRPQNENFELTSQVVILLSQAKVSVVTRNVLVFVSLRYHLFLKIFERFPTFLSCFLNSFYQIAVSPPFPFSGFCIGKASYADRFTMVRTFVVFPIYTKP